MIEQKSDQKIHVEIRGLPVFGDAVLTAENFPHIDWANMDAVLPFVRSLRGQFAIIASGTSFGAIGMTDPFGFYPLYFKKSKRGLPEFSFSAHALARDAGAKLSKEALFSVAAFGRNLTGSSIFTGIEQIPVGSVAFWKPDFSLEVQRYFRLDELLGYDRLTCKDIEDSFLESAEGYLKPIAQQYPGSDCFLSSGVDSSLTIGLLNGIAPRALRHGLCIDYALCWRYRYSEFEDARKNAAVLGLSLERVLCGMSDFYRAIGQLLESPQDNPPMDRALPLQFASLESRGNATGRIVYTGFLADRPFCGFSSWRDSALKYSKAYNLSAPRMTPEEFVAIFYSPDPQRVDVMNTIIECSGFCIDDYERWLSNCMAERVEHVNKYRELDVLQLLMILDQEIAGHLWEEEHLSLECYFGLNFISPFTDLDVVRHGYSLLLSEHFKDGQTKYFLRKMLKKITGLDLHKRAFPSPMRFWALRPENLFCIGNQKLKKEYQKLWINNVLNKGRYYAVTHNFLIMARWLESMQLI